MKNLKLEHKTENMDYSSKENANHIPCNKTTSYKFVTINSNELDTIKRVAKMKTNKH